MVAPPEPAPAARLPPAAATEVMLARFSIVAAWWWPGGLLPGLVPVWAAAVPGGGGICMTPGRMGMAGGGRLLCEPSWLDPEPFCRWTMLGGALSTLELRGGGKRESGGASGRGGPPALGGGGGIPVKTREGLILRKLMRHSFSAPPQIEHKAYFHIFNDVLKAFVLLNSNGF